MQPCIAPELVQPGLLKLMVHQWLGKPLQTSTVVIKLGKNRNVHECLDFDTTFIYRDVWTRLNDQRAKIIIKVSQTVFELQFILLHSELIV